MVDVHGSVNYFPICLKRQPRMVLDVSGGNMKCGTNLILYPFHGGQNQMWHYDGTYIRCQKDPNFVVQVADKFQSGSNLQMWFVDESDDAQKWDFDGTVFRLRKDPNLVIDLHNNKAERSRNIHLWEWNNSGAQKWQLNDVKVVDNVAVPQFFAIRLARNPGWVLDIEGGKMANGTKVILWQHHGRDNQLWVYDGTYIRSKKNTNYVIDVKHCEIKSGTILHVWKCNGNDAQKWDFDGTVFHLRANPNFVIDLDRNCTESRRKIHLWRFNDSGAQKWIHKEYENPIVDALFSILPKTAEYAKYRLEFFKEEVDVEILGDMEPTILFELGVKKMLHHKKIMNAIKHILSKVEYEEAAPPDYVSVGEETWVHYTTEQNKL